MVSLDPARYPLLVATWKRPLHVTDPDPPPGALINPDLDRDAIEASYLGASPNMVTIDGLLTPSALSAIRQWCLENTIWTDDANLDPESGGLVVHSHDAPADWGFRRFNVGHEEIYRYLESVGSRAVRVPHRTNRALLFDSDLFHETDAFRFKPGYENRRINITMLFGAREP